MQGQRSRQPAVFARAVAALRKATHRFDGDAALAAKQAALDRVAAMPLGDGPALPRYHEALLFLAAHPADARMRATVEREFARIAASMKARRGAPAPHLEGEGLPWADTVTRYTHDCVRWLLAHPHCRVAIDGYHEPALDFNEVLRLTLPSLERNETTASLPNDELLDALRVAPARRLAFVVGELGRLDAQPLLKDLLFDKLDLWVRVTPTSRAFSKAWNRLPLAAPVFHQRELLRRFDAAALMNTPLPAARPLERDDAARAEVVRVLKNAMALTSRETDPCTYLDERALRVHDLERGIAVAIFGMTPERQLPLESYVGFTLFKNGLPAAYGGAWLLGPRAAFGMNIFEPYRGGESGWMMCQVLRVYRQAFGVRFFEVDAHQFGLDNPDGIATGAYWFYYRHGFRSLDTRLAKRAEDERARMARDPGHRTSEATLIEFTGSNVALNFDDGPRTAHLFDLTTRVTKLVQRRYRDDRIAAEADAVQRLRERVKLGDALDADEQRVLAEVALVAQALSISDARRLDLLARMVRAKPRDLFGYQSLMLQFMQEEGTPR